MKVNMGNSDRIFRLIAGVVILLLGVYFKSWWGLIGLIPLATALIRWCPLYAPFGFSTLKKQSRE